MIHKYCQNGTYMLLDVNSGIINVIDKMTYDVLDVYDGTNKDAVYQAFAGTYDKKDLDETLGELDELIEKEMLFTNGRIHLSTDRIHTVKPLEVDIPKGRLTVQVPVPEHRPRLQSALSILLCLPGRLRYAQAGTHEFRRSQTRC